MKGRDLSVAIMSVLAAFGVFYLAAIRGPIDIAALLVRQTTPDEAGAVQTVVLWQGWIYEGYLLAAMLSGLLAVALVAAVLHLLGRQSGLRRGSDAMPAQQRELVGSGVNGQREER